MSENGEIAKQIINAVGGKENIQSVTHCATRLRIMINNKDKINTDKIENIHKVKGAFYNAGQYQIIFGTGTVNKIYDEVIHLIPHEQPSTKIKQNENKEGPSFQRAIRTFGDVFVPIIPVLVATGLFMGLRGLLTQKEMLSIFNLLPEDISPNFLLYTQVLTDTAFAFLPALVAWSTFAVFGGSPIIGIVLGLMLVNPILPNAYEVASGNSSPIMMFGFIPVVGYQGTVLPAFISGFIGAKMERWIRKHVSETLDLLVTPFFTLLIMSISSLFIIGPIFHSLEQVILDIVIWLLGFPLGLGGLIIGGLHQVLVITGVHHIFNFLEIQLLANTGANPFNAIITAGIAAQGGATLAVATKTKSKKVKALAYPSALSAMLGITEPAIFGVNLRYRKPFLFGLIGGSAGGFLADWINLKATGMSITVIPGTLLYLNNQILGYLLVNFFAISVAFVLTYLFGFSNQE
ncbi:sucrose-specific PTS transporter subunit IIBC [Garciella nitratireducens]|uniref:PTS system sucrose-specific IIB component, Glc family (TC 4.A.1.2.12)/PTS system sucrose-specific IIC component, Glc family (TC 4.A.1.2.12) n=1 Tax=Garciella nitratireducens DSM 15102 TaxID=1121911 RepID=A0A1T4M4B9_9FIRM|nr:sucrose-specific PTS transporter subunit IIBC [Garciella nitratireducens]RBP44036.1 PTS system sucrose-specific IIB component (Glc family) /PTS system sucrose-specific IIC component (Glc family) [Garciella nitratireducens]SJZ61840.1 PTS system sucrose-specific IIB component, Glc family (TC 4.A.1.2.12)/PTS system sucrose-specific IIC component, Glc family (TC 4.A.1.2.12) [Garciella nitratireducens DSM 15102]